MILTGKNVRVRDFRLDDAKAAAEIIGDDRVTKFLSFDSRPPEAAEAMMEAAGRSASDDPRTEFYMGITPSESDHIVGFIRLALGGVQAAKLGYAIHADHWGNGYATDAVRTVLRYGFDQLELHRVTAAIGPDNAASIQVVEKLGFQREGRLRDHVFTNGSWRDSILYSLLATDPHSEPVSM